MRLVHDQDMVQLTGRHHLRRSIPYERTVSGELSAAIKSLKYTATGSTEAPFASTIRYGSQGSSVFGNWPISGRAKLFRSLPGPLR